MGLSTDKAAVLASHAGVQQLVVADVVKNPYVLEFLGLDEPTYYNESDGEFAVGNRSFEEHEIGFSHL